MKKNFYILLLFLFLVLNLGQGGWGLTESSEARYAEIGREMALNNDFINPTLLGIGHYHKPPLTYIITAVGYKIFGFNEFGARFFLSLALILQLFIVFKIGEIWFKDKNVAIAAALIYFSFPIALIAARNLTTDAYLITFVIWSIYLWLQVKITNKQSYLYGFYLVLGLGFLTKGPVAFLPVALFIICYKIIKREKPKFSIHSSLGLLILLGLSASWFVVIVLHKPELWDFFIQEQIIDRSVHAETFHRAKPIWFYFLLAPLLCLPWVVPVVYDLTVKSKEFKLSTETKISGYSALIILVAFSLFSSKLILYILPLYPFVALFFGNIYVKYSSLSKLEYLNTYKVAFLFLILIVVALPFVPQFQYNWILSTAFLIAISAYGYYFIYKSKYSPFSRVLILSTGAMCFLILIYTSFSSQNSFIINALKTEYTFIKEQRGDSDYKVLVYDNLLSSAPFYLGEQVITIYNSNFEAKRDTRFEETNAWQNSYLPLSEPGQTQRLKKLLSDKKNVLLIKTKKNLPDSLKYLLKGFKAEDFKKWTVYY